MSRDDSPMPRGGWLLIGVLALLVFTAVYLALRFYGLR